MKNRWREYLKKDPEGYYVIKINKKYSHIVDNSFVKIDLGTHLLVKTRSRRKFIKILKKVGLI